ncbi:MULTISPECIES: TlyA family RNA methyltransferase [unclassified Gemella]|uniref:TlyA family RNA methyltransferase n=1 Tax=unclassified Gemella TaxID=2624949 RepID=UPI001074281D|nr:MULTISPECIES: TlyA family RNA methyltransferase [unclassified Gemella]MBF0709983.1 TlyA family RNA methyltransferase [Gemella sp. GL1.1]MBF0746268.1 TlyA family RNA methyltransferase [Gemella sp. 19428wG2_WT2a]NYS27327.1 TlyA family RNA methyltransferase [Gemella sp. GL1]TFU60547.1 TlyA family RNA methyltransferase [Gemella sp. WT2a]
MLRERADILCVNQNLFESREKAKRGIMAGIVYNDTVRIDKPGEKIDVNAELRIKGKKLAYVSRGGLKLEKAIKEYNFSVQNRVMLDIGASTGGFTDCALQNGASYVYALDVGTNQLAWKLRNDDRVCVMEKTNFRYCTKDQFSKPIDRVSIDVSFISLTLILPTLSEIIADNGQVCALIKPQFEAGRDKVGKGGIVRDKNIHLETIEKIYFFANSLGFSVKKLTFSPITGGEGNIEYLIILEYTKEISNNKDIEIVKVVDLAHSKFK